MFLILIFVLNFAILYPMDFKNIKGIQHCLYDNLKEFNALNPKGVLKGHWRQGNQGDWVTTDDEYIVRILKKSKLSHPGYKTPRTYVRTVCGSFIVEQRTHKILGEEGIADNIYAFSGNYDSKKDYEKNRKHKSRVKLFARYHAEGDDVVEAFKKAYPAAKSESYIKEKSSTLINRESVYDMVEEERKKYLDEEGVSAKWIIGLYKDIAELSERDSDKLRSLEALSKMLGLFNTETKKEQVSIWAGFTPEQIEGVKDERTKVLAQAEKGDESS